VDIRSLARCWAATRKRQEESSRAQTIKIHIHFPFQVMPAESRILQAVDGIRRVQQRVVASKHRPIDPDRVLDEFLALPQNETELLSFLDKYGLWEDEEPFEVSEFWSLQGFLRTALLLNPASRGKLLSRSAFGQLPGPLHKSLSVDFEYNQGGLHFVVNTNSCLEAIIARAQIDLANKTRPENVLERTVQSFSRCPQATSAGTAASIMTGNAGIWMS
jgi:hypothetical protein